MMLSRRFVLLVLATAPSIGCTHLQLSRSTTHQALTISDIHYDQVLSNLASFECNPNVLPHFAIVGAGGTLVHDEATANMELEWDTSTLARKLLGLSGTRQVEEQWTLAPIINPDKLRAIRSVYQLATRGENYDPEGDKLLVAFLGSDYAQWIDRNWYGVGCKKDVPRHACYVAHCGQRYVWVTADGIEPLSRLTLAILNISTLDPNPAPAKSQKEIQKYNYTDGKIDSIEKYSRPDPAAEAIPPPPVREQLYNPLQSQIQMGRNK
jgi:hypothetical protein